MKKISIIFCFLFLTVSLCFFILTISKDMGICYNDYKKLDHLISFGEVEDHVTFQLTDMQYSCGECQALYRVDKTISSENNEQEFYFNKEISISFLNKKTEDDFYKYHCESGKPHLIFSGYFRRNSLGGGQLDVTDGSLVCID
ncbi:hypothetical protein P4B29_04350 [Citrobacter freundii]|uniref:hypothetical protein n=1 Tax=Citrobacter freundii TaxID=546 RepID=UPI001BD1B58B|nr:hypothetical protein [Citrobacter freundii]MDF5764582.1 hypothetical protein [Citrobacter freundii]